jgi:hypothetical protein
LTIALLIFSLGGLAEVKAAFPQVFVYPPSQTVDAIGNIFTANVCVSDVFNLYAYEFKLYYNSTVLNGTSVTEGSFLKQSGQNPFFYVEAFTDHYNSTYGIVWIDSTLTGNVLGIDGEGVLATIKFNAITSSNSTSLSLSDVKLSDPNSNQIPYASFNGTVTVLPKNTADFTLSLGSAVNYLKFNVTMSGVLSYKDVGINGASILLSCSTTEGQTWNDITSTNTTFDGSYSAVWTPSATGTYLIKATWAGNDTFQSSQILRALSVTSFNDQYVFSITSNSTVSALVFNSTSRELSFNVTGPSGTTGFVDATIAKSLARDITGLKVYLDGVQLNYAATSTSDSWQLYFTYNHSTHVVTINLGSSTAAGVADYFLYVAIGAMGLALIGTFLALKRRRNSLRSLNKNGKALSAPACC